MSLVTRSRATSRSSPAYGPPLRIDRSIRVQDVDHRQLVPEAAGVVIGIMRRRHLHCAGAQRRVNQFSVGDDRNIPSQERNRDQLADEMPVTRIIGMNRNGSIAEHRLGPGRGKADELFDSL